MLEVYRIIDRFFEGIPYFQDIPKGKGVRSKLILLINKEAHKLAAVVESIHLASLLHDDVIDNADLRRGKPSINALHGERNSIMLGDILYSKAFYELLDYDKSIGKSVSNAVFLLSQGELEDVGLSKSINLDTDKYNQMIYKKTASLIEASCESAALLSGLDAQKYALYGKNLGIVFQIIDDILDIVSDEETLGKPAMSDFKEGKTTLPYIYLYQSLSKEEREVMLQLFKKTLTKEEELWLKERFTKSGVIERSYNEAKVLVKEGIEAIAGESDERRIPLSELMEKLIERNR